MADSIARLCDHWKLDGKLVKRLHPALIQLEAETGLRWSVISGYRTPQEQQRLIDEGRPAAPVQLSTHTECPATGADVRVATFPTRAMKAQFGRVVSEHQLRWGGGSPPDEYGIPLDWNHVDLGPRG